MEAGVKRGIQQEAYSSDWVYLANASLHYKIIDPFEIFY
jgi:hypothetical protein